MAIQLSVTVRNARLDAIEDAIGANPVLKIRTGAPPASTAAADTGTVLASLDLPANWMQDASGGSKAKAGTWEDLTADASGTAGHYRIYDSGGTAHLQGTITVSGGGGDMTVVSTSISAGQVVTVSSFVINEANS